MQVYQSAILMTVNWFVSELSSKLFGYLDSTQNGQQLDNLQTNSLAVSQVTD